MMKTLGQIEELLLQEHSNAHQYTVALLLERLFREVLNSLSQPNEVELADNIKVISQLAKKLQYGLPDTKEVKTVAIAASIG
jgi:predicted house-cleaning noncanonical NTP pyrophosphatase (MazG superfamily)